MGDGSVNSRIVFIAKNLLEMASSCSFRMNLLRGP